MISNNVLSDRLNAFKNGEEIDLESQEFEVPEETTLNKTEFWSSLLVNTVSMAAQSIIYGYGIQTIMNADWKFLGMAAVGFTLFGILGALKIAFTK